MSPEPPAGQLASFGKLKDELLFDLKQRGRLGRC